MRLPTGLLGALAIVQLFVCPASTQEAAPVEIGAHDIGGVVKSANGPEGGVWVIAETRDLGTRFAKIVVTDDAGRFVIPDLPEAHYQVWVRGYDLVDAPKVAAERGQHVNLDAVIAPDRAAAAQYYPAIYWFSLLRPPAADRFPGTGPNGNGIPTEFKTRDQWLDVIKTNGCGNCHQIGNYATRTMPPAFDHFQSGIAAWARRLQSGPGGTTMVHTMGRLLTPDGGHLAALADWTDRIKAGELPKLHRRVRPVSSATSSSRCATGSIRNIICMTSWRPTSASRP
ncbi:carboxypeptidase-like regulatory domain-containing protein [Bradyrhizobium sp. ISRA435]|nr:carboxypeptidase-like regulatory domain-containing protein [Bradyrhizobium sp. ISRA435]